MTRFMGVIQILSSLAAAFFNFFIFEHSLTHFRWILIGITIVYAAGMSIMCLCVKEPQFPEPDPEEKRQSKGIRAMITFTKVFRTAFTGTRSAVMRQWQLPGQPRCLQYFIRRIWEWISRKSANSTAGRA